MVDVRNVTKSSQKKSANFEFADFVSGWQDSNLRPPHPKCGAIPGYATPRLIFINKSLRRERDSNPRHQFPSAAV